MSTGAGIAIAGVWLFAGMVFTSKNVTSMGSYLAVIVASAVTYFIVH